MSTQHTHTHPHSPTHTVNRRNMFHTTGAIRLLKSGSDENMFEPRQEKEAASRSRHSTLGKSCCDKWCWREARPTGVGEFFSHWAGSKWGPKVIFPEYYSIFICAGDGSGRIAQHRRHSSLPGRRGRSSALSTAADEPDERWKGQQAAQSNDSFAQAMAGGREVHWGRVLPVLALNTREILAARQRCTREHRVAETFLFNNNIIKHNTPLPHHPLLGWKVFGSLVSVPCFSHLQLQLPRGTLRSVWRAEQRRCFLSVGAAIGRRSSQECAFAGQVTDPAVTTSCPLASCIRSCNW